MRLLTIIFFLLLCLSQALAQDRIITVENDTIVCRIKNETMSFIVFEVGDGLENNTLSIQKKVVSKVIYDEDKFVDDETPSQQEIRKKYKIYEPPTLRFDAGYTYSNWLESSALTFENLLNIQDPRFQNIYNEYFNEMRNGTNFYIEGAYYWQDNLGAGLEYSQSEFSNTLDGVVLTFSDSILGDTSIIGAINEQISIIQVNPKFFYSWFTSTIDITLGGSFNFTAFKRDIFLPGDLYIPVQAAEIGIGGSAAIDYKINPNIAFGVRASLALTVFSEYNIDGLNYTVANNDVMSASQFTIGFGLKVLL
jgi:hypothetical protein